MSREKIGEWYEFGDTFASLKNHFNNRIVGLLVEIRYLNLFPEQIILIGNVNVFGNDEDKPIDGLLRALPYTIHIIRYQRVWDPGANKS